MVTFIYLAHSQERFRKQTVYSVLTLLEYLRKSSLLHPIVVYTDEPGYFDPVEVETVKLSEENIVDWRGEIDFVHRMKIGLLLDASERFDGKLFLLDSDNCVFRDPTKALSEWNEDEVFMSNFEYRLDNPSDLLGKKYKRFFRKNAQFKGASQEYTVNMEQQCWNAGVVGLTSKAATYLPDVLALCDQMHRLFPKHLSEQMAFNIVMAAHFKIVGFSDIGYHWFGHGQAINRIIDSLLENYPVEEFDKLITSVKARKTEVLNAPLNPDKLPWYRRWLGRISSL